MNNDILYCPYDKEHEISTNIFGEPVCCTCMRPIKDIQNITSEFKEFKEFKVASYDIHKFSKGLL